MISVTIIIVSYNAGDRLLQTVNSIQTQSDPDWQLIIKDGGSTDGSVERVKAVCGDDSRIHIYTGRDKGIYDAMNIAIEELKRLSGETGGYSGRYVLFLGCGDTLADTQVISHIREAINGRWYLEKLRKETGTASPGNESSAEMAIPPVVFYGDVIERATGQRVASNPRLDDYACYRNVPCHQACLYDERLLFRYPFDTVWKVRSDYEQFLRIRYRGGARSYYINLPISEFAGGGFSETAENLRVSEEERKQIISKYLPPGQIRRFDLMRALTLAPLRTKLARSPVTAGAYNALKSGIYHLKHPVIRSS